MHPILPLVSTSARPLGRLGRRRGNLGHLVASRCRFGDLRIFTDRRLPLRGAVAPRLAPFARLFAAPKAARSRGGAIRGTCLVPPF